MAGRGQEMCESFGALGGADIGVHEEEMLEVSRQLAACTPQPAARRDAAPTPHEPAAAPQAPQAPTPAAPVDTVEVRGRVRAWDGAAIAGAIITAREDAALAGAAPGEADPALARTDAAGQFTLRLPPGGLVELHAAAPGHADGLDEAPAPGHAFDL